MKIYFKASGGFMGDRSSINLDTNSLSSNEARQLRDFINSSNFFELPSKSLPPPRGAADYFQYKITIESDDGRKSHTLETNDITMAPSLVPLIDFLQDKANKTRCSN